MRIYNRGMSEVRVAVMLIFGNITKFFQFIYIYIHHCGKVIGISKKRSLKGCVYSHCNFFYICNLNLPIDDICVIKWTERSISWMAIQNCWIILEMLSCSFCRTFVEMLFHAFWRTSHNSSCYFGCFFYLNSFDQNTPRSLQWYSNYDSVAAIP